ncbi:MAG: LacI family DNA-binding transcriptional regulator [Lachnospiraceae bacterium]|nr:LacI family DNA-binding transcriptional regulator [Lachnospiraceae bacterium]
MAATIKDIRAETGLGLATISKYLNGGNVRTENRQKIEEAIKKLDYHPNETARSLVTKRTRTIGFVVNNIASNFSGVLLQHASAYLHTRGYGMMICDSSLSEKQEAENIRFCVEKQVDGILIVSSSREAAFLSPAEKAGIPAVLLDREIKSDAFDCVTIDNRNAAERATDYLIECGHRKIAVICSEEYTGTERYKGYLASLEKAGIKPRDSYICPGQIHSPELGYRNMKRLLKLKERPTAVLTTNYEVSLGVIMALNEEGVGCPEDMSLIGFDELILPMVMKPKLTLVAQPMEEIACEGARILLKRIEEGSSFPPQRVSLYASLKSGESVKRIG